MVRNSLSVVDDLFRGGDKGYEVRKGGAESVGIRDLEEKVCLSLLRQAGAVVSKIISGR